ncbi:MAG: FAD-binding protein, partial [Raoultibacter sp.]
EDVFIKANKGVILATGGMAQNPEMLKKYVPSVGYRALTATASMMDTGEGILAAWGAGADMQGYDASFCFDGGIDCGTWNHYLYKGDVQVARQPWLGINIQGERYPYWPVDNLGFTHQCGILMSQPRNRGYVVFDANYEETIWNWEATGKNQMICRRPMWPEGEGDKMWNTGGNYERLPEGICEHDWRTGFQQGVDGGYIFECQTLDELAEKIDMPADKLKKAVDDWNKLCEAGVDDQWHFDPAWLVPIKDAPYYGMAVGSTVLATNCGVPVTTECQAIGTNGVPIEGLYAVGSCIGGIGGDSTYGDCRNPGGGVALTCGTAYMAANALG